MLNATGISEDNLGTIVGRIRRLALVQIYLAGSGHPGGSLSAADILTYLYFRELRFSPARPDWPGRDRFVLSKGHACPALYAAAAEVGLIPHRMLLGLRRLGSPLQGYPHVLDTPGLRSAQGPWARGSPLPSAWRWGCATKSVRPGST